MKLIASFSTCVLLAGVMAGCEGKSPSQVTGKELESLLEQMDRLEYAYAPSADNARVYSAGTTVGEIDLPGRATFEAAYIDEALTLLPQAQKIASSGNAKQKQAAQSIIASILTDEGGHLINEADRVFQKQVSRFSILRKRTDMVKDIMAYNTALAGDGAAIIDTLQTGEIGNGQTVDGIKQLSEQASAADQAAAAANAELAKTVANIEKLREEALELEALDLKLTNEANAATNDARFPKLESATKAMAKAQTSQAKAESLTIDASIHEDNASLASGRSERAKAVINELQDKIEQKRDERKLVADKLAELEQDRQAALKALTDAYNGIDALMQVGGFDRMTRASELLVEAQDALTAANLGGSAEIQQMGLYTLRARCLHQQALASRTYEKMLGTLAASGPEVLGNELHSTLTQRITQMQELDDATKAAANELKGAAGATLTEMGSLDAASPEGKVASNLVQLFNELIVVAD